MKPWSQWVQENTGTLFCLGSFFGLLIFTVHVEHHGDHDLVNWAMNLGFGAFTAFLALIKASNKSAFSDEAQPPGTKLTAQIEKQTPPLPIVAGPTVVADTHVEPIVPLEPPKV